MPNLFAKTLTSNPLIAIEAVIYSMMVLVGLWGLAPVNETAAYGRLANEFGVNAMVLDYSVFIVLGVAGFLSVLTARIEHRINTTLFAFLVFASGVVANIILMFSGGHVNAVHLAFNVASMFIAGIIHLHLKVAKRSGVRGRGRVNNVRTR